jgi:ribulose bisphosphate carboxylase small subunit
MENKSQRWATLRRILTDKEIRRKLDQSPFEEWEELRKLYTEGRDPMAPIIGAIYDEGQFRAEIAWSIPLIIKYTILGGKPLTPQNIKSVDPRKFLLGPRGKNMGEAIIHNAREILDRWGSVENLFTSSTSAFEIYENLISLEQIGKKKALMLTKDFAIAVEYRKMRTGKWCWLDPFADQWKRKYPKEKLRELEKISIPPDVHCRRVVGRIIGKEEKATEKELEEFGRRVYPEFPAWIDTPLWLIGRNYCHEEKPECGKCYLKRVCNMAKNVS